MHASRALSEVSLERPATRSAYPRDIKGEELGWSVAKVLRDNIQVLVQKNCAEESHSEPAREVEPQISSDHFVTLRRRVHLNQRIACEVEENPRLFAFRGRVNDPHLAGLAQHSHSLACKVTSKRGPSS